MIRVQRHELGPRVFILGRRTHHGEIGVLLTVLGALLAAHDRRDWREWLR